MTKQEFIQEAALRLITANTEVPVSFVAELAKELADEIFKEGEQPVEEPQQEQPKEKPKTTASQYFYQPISTLVNEVDRLDREEIIRIKNDFKAKHGHELKTKSKIGYGARLKTTCTIHLHISTVGELLSLGRINFYGHYVVGQRTIQLIDQALFNLYGITEW